MKTVSVVANGFVAADDPLTNALVRVQKLDLEPIKKKLMAPAKHGGQEWSVELTDECIELYRKYLVLCAIYPQAHLVPTRDIDTAWHYHILDTHKYAADCDEFFGYFLHHNPNYSPETVGGDYKHSARRTVDLFLKHFEHEPRGEHMLCSGFPCDAGECKS